jgi:hypothetical protein
MKTVTIGRTAYKINDDRPAATYTGDDTYENEG